MCAPKNCTASWRFVRSYCPESVLCTRNLAQRFEEFNVAIRRIVVARSYRYYPGLRTQLKTSLSDLSRIGQACQGVDLTIVRLDGAAASGSLAGPSRSPDPCPRSGSEIAGTHRRGLPFGRDVEIRGTGASRRVEVTTNAVSFGGLDTVWTSIFLQCRSLMNNAP
jgi:hypothetical protein